jgi:O-antigen ligase
MNSPSFTSLQVYGLRFLLFLFLIPNEIRKKQDLNSLMKTLALSGWLLMLSFVGTLLLHGYSAGSRLTIFGGNLNDSGILALIAMIGVLWQISVASRRWQNWTNFLGILFILGTLVLVAMTGSRGCALSMAVTILAFGFWKSTRRWAKLTFLLIILALIFTPTIFTTLVQRFVVDGREAPFGGREVLWDVAWRVIQDHPLGGVGIGNSPYATVPYLNTGPYILETEMVVVHNPVLTVWSETGILGILIYLGILASSIFVFIQQYLACRKTGPNDLLLYFVLVASVAFGYSVSWIKGGGMESSHSYFLILSMLALPSTLDISSFRTGQSSQEELDP